MGGILKGVVRVGEHRMLNDEAPYIDGERAAVPEQRFPMS